MLHVSALASDEIRAVLLALKQAEPAIRTAINKASKETILPIWKESLARQQSRNEGKQAKARYLVMVKTAKVTVGARGVTLTAATSGKALSGGLQPKTQWHALEFGGYSAVRSVRFTSTLGNTYTQQRDVAAQLDYRRKKGYVFYPAARVAVPRILSLWVQTSVRTFHEIIEGRR
jgi:hypothetical protein